MRRCKQLGRALRIGTNHGSLSDRIMNRYGDTPLGMVESALEFLDVCEDEGYRDVVFSMKSSNAQVAIQAYRLLAARLEQRAPGEPSYPFHVGVTEAGDAEDGRIKSAIGIGSLLEDGIGDTIRVSLTEDPVKEVPVAAALARHCEARWALRAPRSPDPGAPFVDDPFAPPPARDPQRRPRPRTRSAASTRCAWSSTWARVPADPSGFAQAARATRSRACASSRAKACWSRSLDPEAFARLPEFARALADAGLARAARGRASSRVSWLDARRWRHRARGGDARRAD